MGQRKLALQKLGAGSKGVVYLCPATETAFKFWQSKEGAQQESEFLQAAWATVNGATAFFRVPRVIGLFRNISQYEELNEVSISGVEEEESEECVLVMEMMGPLPLVWRERIHSHLQDRLPANLEGFTARLYLGETNCSGHVDLETVLLDATVARAVGFPVMDLLRDMGRCYAILHHGVGIDSADVEFVAGSVTEGGSSKLCFWLMDFSHCRRHQGAAAKMVAGMLFERRRPFPVRPCREEDWCAFSSAYAEESGSRGMDELAVQVMNLLEDEAAKLRRQQDDFSAQVEQALQKVKERRIKRLRTEECCSSSSSGESDDDVACSVKQYISLHVGEAGVDLAQTSWELFSREAETCSCSKACLFHEVDRVWKPRAVLIGDDNLSQLCGPFQLLRTGNRTTNEELANSLCDSIRSLCDTCDHLGGFILADDPSSKLSSMVLNLLSDHFPKLPKLSFLIFADGKYSGNAAAIRCHLEHSDVCTVFETRDKRHLLPKVLASVTSGLRLGGSLNEDIQEIQQNLVPSQNKLFKFLLASYVEASLPIVEVAAATLEDRYVLANCSNGLGTHLAPPCLQLRGDVMPRMARGAALAVRSRLGKVATWCAEKVLAGCSPVVAKDTAACLLMNNTSVGDVFRRRILEDKAGDLDDGDGDEVQLVKEYLEY